MRRQKKTPIDHLFRSLTRQPLSGGEDHRLHRGGRGRHRRRRQPGAGLHPPAHAGHRAQGAGHPATSILSSSQLRKYLQETIITQRSGRYVVPVKSEHKNDMPGLVHDMSSSGATFFIEPMGVVKANNELQELQAKEEKEIDRILAELSAEAAAFREDISLGLRHR